MHRDTNSYDDGEYDDFVDDDGDEGGDDDGGDGENDADDEDHVELMLMMTLLSACASVVTIGVSLFTNTSWASAIMSSSPFDEQ